MIRKDFITVTGLSISDTVTYVDVQVPTKEEYDDFRQRVSSAFDMVNEKIHALEERISILESNVEKKHTSNPTVDGKKIKVSLASTRGPIELEGTEEQLNTFWAERKERDDALFPRFLSFENIVSLAIGCGLSVKTPDTK